MSEDFLREVSIMKEFNHPNIMCPIGVSVHVGNPCALLALMINGDLKKFLNNNIVSSLIIF